MSLSRRTFLTGCCAAGLVGVIRRNAGAQGAGARGPIDVHAHYFPEPFVKAINEQGGPPGVFSKPDAPIFVIGGGRIPIDVTYWDLEKRLKRMDAQGVRTHALSTAARPGRASGNEEHRAAALHGLPAPVSLRHHRPRREALAVPDRSRQRPREIIDALKLSAADRDRIYSGNAARVLGL